MANWVHCLEPLEKLESCMLLELKALHEGTWKMGEFMVFSQHLVMQVTVELNTLLKVVPKGHPEHAMLIDGQQYKPTWIVGVASAIPKKLDFTSTTAGKWEDDPDKPVNLDAMHCALGKVSLPPKARFVLGKMVYVQFDGSS